MAHNKFQKIKQFRHINKMISDAVVKYHTLSEFPTLTFVGTVKFAWYECGHSVSEVEGILSIKK